MSDFMTVPDYRPAKKKLSRKERVRLRNKKILNDLATGITRSQVQEEYRLSDRSLRRILKQAYDGQEEWYNNLPKQGMISIFRDNTKEVFDELEKLRTIRESVDDSKTKFGMTREIISSLIDYNRMVAEGPALTRYKELTKKMEDSLDKRGNVIPEA